MKKLKVIEFALLILSAAVFVVAVLTVTDESSETLDLYMGWTYALIAIALAATLGFPLVRACKSWKSLLKLVALIVSVVVIIGGAYLLAPGNPLTNLNAQVDPADLKFADTALYIGYLFVAAAVVALLWSGIHKAIKK